MDVAAGAAPDIGMLAEEASVDAGAGAAPDIAGAGAAPDIAGAGAAPDIAGAAGAAPDIAGAAGAAPDVVVVVVVVAWLLVSAGNVPEAAGAAPDACVLLAPPLLQPANAAATAHTPTKATKLSFIGYSPSILSLLVISPKCESLRLPNFS